MSRVVSLRHNLGPSDAVARAEALIADRRFDKAAELCRRHLALDPPAPVELRLILGRALMSLHCDAEAEAEMRECLRLDPRCAQACRMLGELAFRQDRYDVALEALERAMKLAPGDKATQALLDIVRQMGQRVAHAASDPASAWRPAGEGRTGRTERTRHFQNEPRVKAAGGAPARAPTIARSSPSPAVADAFDPPTVLDDGSRSRPMTRRSAADLPPSRQPGVAAPIPVAPAVAPTVPPSDNRMFAPRTEPPKGGTELLKMPWLQVQMQAQTQLARKVHSQRTMVIVVGGAALLSGVALVWLMSALHLMPASVSRASGSKMALATSAAAPPSPLPAAAAHPAENEGTPAPAQVLSTEGASHVEPQPVAPADGSWTPELAADTWIHPLMGPVRRMPVRDGRVFGAERAGDRPVECRSGHCGVDIGETWGEPVMAAHDGVVDRVQRGPNEDHGGLYVRIAHRRGTVFTQYFHLAVIPRRIVVGLKIKASEVVGLVGDSGVHRSGPHLHFTISVRPNPNGPEEYMDPEPLIAIWPLRVPAQGGVGTIINPLAAPGMPLGAARHRSTARERSRSNRSERHSEVPPTTED